LRSGYAAHGPPSTGASSSRLRALATTCPFGPTITAPRGSTRWTAGGSQVAQSRAAARRKGRSEPEPDQGDTGNRQTGLGPRQAVQVGPAVDVIATTSASTSTAISAACCAPTMSCASTGRWCCACTSGWNRPDAPVTGGQQRRTRLPR
jgi:hypothetical protein